MAATQEERTVNANVPSGADGTHPAKSVLKEAVDAVLNSFAKHTHGYGRGKLKVIQTFLIIYKQRCDTAHGHLYCLAFVFTEIKNYT